MAILVPISDFTPSKFSTSMILVHTLTKIKILIKNENKHVDCFFFVIDYHVLGIDSDESI